MALDLFIDTKGSELFRAQARAGLFQGGRQDSNAGCRAPKSELVLQNDMAVGGAK